MIKKVLFIIGLVSVLCISLQDKHLNTKMPDSFIEKANEYTSIGNMYHQPYWVLFLIIISVCVMFYVYKKNSH